ncbi:MAG: hypothetical protein NTX49_07995 [Chlamydiae bacterium]|nr:hypothetical protein [Chlamydiota bacterium]
MINWEKISLEDLAGFLSEELRKRDVDVILVGGACVTIYSRNLYQSYDLDFIAYEDMKKVKEALAQLGFYEKGGYFCHNKCDWFVDFVSSPVAIGNEIISEFQEMQVQTGSIKMLRVEDTVKDRLAGYFYWKDIQGLDQAIIISLERKVDLKEVENWSIKEGFQKEFQEFQKRLEKAKE